MSTVPALPQDALSESYDDIKKLIYKIAHGFAHSRNVPFEELRSVVDLSFVKAYAEFTHKRGSKLSSWVAFVAMCELRTYLKRTHRYRHWLELNEEIAGAEEYDASFLFSLRSELGKDANAVVSLLVESSSDMQILLRGNDARGKLAVLRTLREHLTDVGWTELRVDCAFSEIAKRINPATHNQREEDRDLRRLGLTREDVFLLARTGLTAKDVRMLLAA